MGPVAFSSQRHRRFEQLGDEVLEPLHRYLHRRAPADMADDALADTLVVLWRRLDDVPADQALPWAYGVARRCLANARRSARRQERVVTALTAQRTPVADELPLDAELDAALARLGQEDRELLRLWAWEQLEPRELAVVLDTTPGAISTRLTRAKARLAEQLEVAREDPAVTGHMPSRRREEDPS